MYLVDDDFLDAVDDLVAATREIPRTSVMGMSSMLTDLQAKRQKVQDMMDDGFDTAAPELKESEQDEDSR
ncbi:hypothetical protein [uncultured Acidaminococcus sp.]|uniref:hypothetical protein n=1 Tax=uncultured Acidaminococcus sp. TaxID=352152 RepID=UPI00259A5331|nr:hypothetical protein [uncultured Acidaminococcus sp.]